jgi:manganese/zinc/iron transport system ATP- binding protein
MTEESYAIEVTDLTVAYRDKPVLWDVDLQAPPGILMAIVGPNGAGKTTLLKAILGLVKPAAGQVLIYGASYAHQRHLVVMSTARQRGWDFHHRWMWSDGTCGSLGWITARQA